MLLISVLYVLIKSNLISIIRLTKKNIEVYLRDLNKVSHIVINKAILGYINIKNNFYYLRIVNTANLAYRLVSSLTSENSFTLLAINNDDYYSKSPITNIKCYTIFSLQFDKDLKN